MAKTLKKTKSLKTSRKVRVTRPNVVSFRITTPQSKNLKAVHERDSALGVKTPNQLARKIVCDYLAGRLEYRDPTDRQQDFDAAG